MLTEITAPAGVLGLLESGLPPRTEVAFERTVAFPGRRGLSVRVSGKDTEAAIEGIREGRLVEGVSPIADTPEGRLYRLVVDRTPALIERVHAADGTVFSATAADGAWTFELRFPSRDAASAFYTGYDDPEYPITIQSTSTHARPSIDAGSQLTQEQHATLARALEAGYFDVPRRTTLVDLAEEFDVSDSAVSQRLRRGLRTLLQDPSLLSQGRSRGEFTDD